MAGVGGTDDGIHFYILCMNSNRAAVNYEADPRNDATRKSNMFRAGTTHASAEQLALALLREAPLNKPLC